MRGALLVLLLAELTACARQGLNTPPHAPPTLRASGADVSDLEVTVVADGPAALRAIRAEMEKLGYRVKIEDTWATCTMALSAGERAMMRGPGTADFERFFTFRADSVGDGTRIVAKLRLYSPSTRTTFEYRGGTPKVRDEIMGVLERVRASFAR